MLFFRSALDALQQRGARGGHLLLDGAGANVVEVRMFMPDVENTRAELLRFFVGF